MPGDPLRGVLFPGEPHPWPYLVFRFIPGVSIGTQFERIAISEKKRLAGWLGERVRKSHEIPLSTSVKSSLPRLQSLLTAQIEDCIQRQMDYEVLPLYLIEQIGPFLEATQSLPHFSKPHHLIHADITSDHILGERIADTWKTKAIIDFGDAMLGNLIYELNAIHLDLFRRNKFLLREFISGYGEDILTFEEIPLAGIRMTLLHRFPAFGFLENGRLNPSNCPNLYDLADQLWNINTPESELF
jgi:aminoglycoside phosphotransferase (APT) family kinase protein